MIGTLFKELGGFLDRRFFLTIWVPCQIFWLALLALAVGGSGEGRVIAWWERRTTVEQVALIILGLAWGTMSAYLFAGRQGWVMRLYEGYWADVPVLCWLAGPQKAYYQQQLAQLAAQALLPDKAQADSAVGQIYSHYPPSELPELVLPTRLGNLMRSAEVYPLVRYGLDGVLAWPRLYAVLPEAFTKAIGATKSDMDLMLVLSALGAAFAVVGGFITALVGVPWYVTLGACWGGALLSWLGYQGLLQATQSYTQLVRAAFDVYRGTLLKTIGWELPTSLEEEQRRWEQITKLWFRQSPDIPDGARSLGYPAAKPHKDEAKQAAEPVSQVVILKMTISQVAEERGR